MTVTSSQKPERSSSNVLFCSTKSPKHKDIQLTVRRLRKPQKQPHLKSLRHFFFVAIFALKVPKTSIVLINDDINQQQSPFDASSSDTKLFIQPEPEETLI